MIHVYYYPRYAFQIQITIFFDLATYLPFMQVEIDLMRSLSLSLRIVFSSCFVLSEVRYQTDTLTA